MLKTQETLVKVTGLRDDIHTFVRFIEARYIVVPTSKIIKHQEDELSHIYLKIIEKPVFSIPDQFGNKVCLKNLEAPGSCTPDLCPYDGKEVRG